MADLPYWLQTLSALAPTLLWFLFCLWAINWQKLSAFLREGAWVPALLLIDLVALVWSRVTPRSVALLGVLTVPNFWWEFGVVSAYACLGLFAGWLQLKYGLAPQEVSLEPPAHGHDQHHGDGHHHTPIPQLGKSATHTEEKFVDTGGEH